MKLLKPPQTTTLSVRKQKMMIFQAQKRKMLKKELADLDTFYRDCTIGNFFEQFMGAETVCNESSPSSKRKP